MTQLTIESDQPVILIVDHSPTALCTKSQLFRRQGFRIIEATTGADALAVVTAERPDLILLDADLSDIDGFAVCRQLKAQPETQLIKVLQTSAAHINAPERMRSLEVGADAFLIEPASEEELIGTVRALLKWAKHERYNRERTEDELRDAERRYRAIFEQAGVGVAQIDSRTGRFERVNRKYCEIVGRTEAEMLATTFMSITHPQDLADDLTGLEHLRGGLADSFAMEKRYVRKDGSIVWVLLNVAPLRKPGEELSQHIAVVQDITERKYAEERLRESETRFKTLADSAPVLMWMNDREGARFVNRAYLEFLGVSGQVVVGKYDWAAFVHPEDRQRYLQAYLSAFEKHALFDEQFRFRRHDGLYRWMRSVGQPRHSSSGELLGYVGATYDITEIKEAQARLERWSVELEHAVNVKTAELQQSQERLRALTSELNLAEQRERKRLATELHDHLQQMLVLGKLTIGQGKRAASGVPACENILKKVDDILSEALTYSRTLVAELSPPVLRDHGLIASLKWLAEYMKKKHEHTVTVIVPDDPRLNLPEDQRVLLFQSVRELLINSAKHAGTGRASLTMEKRADHLRITVKDEGTGFDLAAVAEAGVPSGEISSKFGLYSIQERMRALGGSFTIHSAPRQGTIATLILPLLRSAEDNQLHPLVPESEPPYATVRANDAESLTKGRMMVPVLLVDDHAMVRQGLRSVLDAYADIQVVGEAGDGAEAVKLVETLRPWVVVMDINMPKMNGIEATTQIKIKWPETTIIGISVNIGDDNGDAMQRAGAATLLTKEAAVEQLHDTIIQAVGAHNR
jgi:PAS domain S-box-containing protein